MGISGHTSGSAVVGATIATTVLAGIAVALRLYTRLILVRKSGLDDVCISVALVLAVILTVAMCEQVTYGMGSHYWTLSETERKNLLIWFWASVWIYYLALCFTKLSVVLQYLRIFPHSKGRIAAYILMGVIILYSCCTVFLAVFLCVPVQRFWDPNLKGSCNNSAITWYVNTSINIATDICTTILPLPVLTSLQLPRRQKWALLCVFGLGGFTCVVSILRLQSLIVIAAHIEDASWYNPMAAIWSSTELNVGILCSCLPTLKGLISHLLPRLLSSAASKRRSSGFLVNAPVPEGPRNRTSMLYTDDEGLELSGGVQSIHKTDIYACESSYMEQGLPRDEIRVDTVFEQEERKSVDGMSYSESSSMAPTAPPLVYHAR